MSSTSLSNLKPCAMGLVAPDHLYLVPGGCVRVSQPRHLLCTSCQDPLRASIQLGNFQDKSFSSVKQTGILKSFLLFQIGFQLSAAPFPPTKTKRVTCLHLQSTEFHLGAGLQDVPFCCISSTGEIFIFCTTSVSPTASSYSLQLCCLSH